MSSRSTVTHTFSCFELAARTEDEDTHTEVVGLHVVIRRVPETRLKTRNPTSQNPPEPEPDFSKRSPTPPEPDLLKPAISPNEFYGQNLKF